MYSSPTSPQSPSSRRRPRRTSSTSSNGRPMPINTSSRRSSQYSPISRRSSRAFGDADSYTSPGAGNGEFGSNLADELANAFYDDEGIDEGASEGGLSPLDGTRHDSFPNVKVDPERVRDSGIDVASAATTPVKDTWPTSARPSSKHGRKHSRTLSQPFTSQSEEQVDGLSASFNARLAEIEHLARQGTSSLDDHVPLEADEDQQDTTESSTSGMDRFLNSLRELGGSNSSIESGTTRLITAHGALAQHLMHQTRQVHSLSFGLVLPAFQQPTRHATPAPNTSDAPTTSSRSISPMPDEDLTLLLSSLLTSLPQPSHAALDSIHQLSTLTAETAAALSSLADSLHMNRQTTQAAARSLRGARELLADIQRHEAAREEGEKWIEEGRWGERLKKRDCEKECRDVVSGFEQVCESLRGRLIKSAGGA